MTDLVLDTHVFIWLMMGDSTLPLKIRETIADSLSNANVSLSAISCWEIAMLEQRGRIVLTEPCLKWIETGLHRSGIQILELTPEISVESCNLPGEIHGDPADRMIIAGARLSNSTLITRDKIILNYAKKHYLRVMKA